MTADIFSLSKARKTKARSAKEQQAAENRVLFGRTKAEKMLQERETKRADKALDGMRLSRSRDNESLLTKK